MIPKSGDPRHVEENRAAADIELTAEDSIELDKAFPRPKVRRCCKAADRLKPVTQERARLEEDFG